MNQVTPELAAQIRSLTDENGQLRQMLDGPAVVAALKAAVEKKVKAFGPSFLGQKSGVNPNTISRWMKREFDLETLNNMEAVLSVKTDGSAIRPHSASPRPRGRKRGGHAQRDMEILRLAKDGYPLDDIAESYNLSRQRVYQITGPLRELRRRKAVRPRMADQPPAN